ncbi:MAG: hypothetical protein K2W95_17420 [Candidatus Obscuribacterales bacterium]|nr:hypothetical protein [Candidatus Obscuribacterales bacterium]
MHETTSIQVPDDTNLAEHLETNESILIGTVEFEGPFRDGEDLLPLPGIFAIVCQSKSELELLTLDESHCLKDCLNSSEYEDNMLFFSEHCKGALLAIVHYTPAMSAAERIALKNELLAQMMTEETATQN